MHSLFSVVAATAALLLAPASAQTWTNCDPLKKSCKPDKGLDRRHYEVDFVKQGQNGMKRWATTASQVSYGPKGAVFTINKEGDSPTIQSDFHLFFGRLEVEMLAAPGQGVISSVVLQSSDLDEIDWEFVGSDTINAQSNFFGKGNTTTYDRGAYHPLVGPPQLKKHTYAIDWTAERLQYIVDGKVLRTVPYNDPLALFGKTYPQTPMNVRIGIWAGGHPSNSPGTISWAGGPIDYGAGPYTMYVQKIKVTNNNPAKAYKYSDKSGSYQSIRKIQGSSKRDMSTPEWIAKRHGGHDHADSDEHADGDDQAEGDDVPDDSTYPESTSTQTAATESSYTAPASSYSAYPTSSYSASTSSYSAPTGSSYYPPPTSSYYSAPPGNSTNGYVPPSYNPTGSLPKPSGPGTTYNSPAAPTNTDSSGSSPPTGAADAVKARAGEVVVAALAAVMLL